jgi:hypothetical protein
MATTLPCVRCGAPVDRTPHGTLSQTHHGRLADGRHVALLMVFYACRTPRCGDGWGRSRLVLVADTAVERMPEDALQGAPGTSGRH